MASRQATQLLKLVKKTFPKAKITETALGEMVTIKKEFSNSVIVLAEILAENPNQYFVHAKTINAYFGKREEENFKQAFEFMKETEAWLEAKPFA